jgi:hypothetical protein
VSRRGPAILKVWYGGTSPFRGSVVRAEGPESALTRRYYSDR